MKKIHPIAAFVAVALISLAMAGYAYFATQEAARIKFVAAVNDAQDRIESRMELHLSLLRATKALFESQDGDVSPSEYAAFYKALDVSDHFAGLHGIGLIRVVKAGEEAAVERDLSVNLGVERKVHPPSSLPQHAVTVLVEPHDGYSDPVIGFDMMVDPARREAIEQALDDNGAHATGRVLLGDKTGASRNFAGFLVFTRLTRQAGSDLPGTGLVYNAFRAEDLFQTALAKTPLLPVSVEVYDGDVSDDSLMFRSETPPSSSLAESLATVRKFTMAGRQWTVLFRPTSLFRCRGRRGLPGRADAAGQARKGRVPAAGVVVAVEAAEAWEWGAVWAVAVSEWAAGPWAVSTILRPVTAPDRKLSRPAVASGYSGLSSSPRALAAETCLIASASVAASCAPITAYLPSSRKHGTPVTPMRAAVSISPRTDSTSASVGNSVSTIAVSMSASRAASTSTAGSPRFPPSSKLSWNSRRTSLFWTSSPAAPAQRMTRCASSVLGATLMASKSNEMPSAAPSGSMRAWISRMRSSLPNLPSMYSRRSLPSGGMVGSSWNGRQWTRTSTPLAAIALSSRFWPMKHQGQTTSETTSTVMEAVSVMASSFSYG